MKIVRSSFCYLLVLLTMHGLSVGQSNKHANNYFLVLLNRPPNAPQLSPDDGEKLQAAHMANIRKLHAEHKLVMAGPFMDETFLRGIFVLAANNKKKATAWTNSDPAVKAGRLSAEIYGPWTIHAVDIHAVDEDVHDMEQYTFILLKHGDRWAQGPTSDLMKQHAAFMQSQKNSIAIDGLLTDGQSDLYEVVIYRIGLIPTSDLMQQDPAIQARLLTVEIHPWITAKGVLAPGQPLAKE
jgi:uncharacterized protein YciI